MAVSEAFFAMPEAAGFVLVGGAALISHGLVDRPTRDLDFFDVSPGQERDVYTIAQAFQEMCTARGWACFTVKRTSTFSRFIVQGPEELEVDLAIDSPIFDDFMRTSLGPTPSWLDLAAMKLSAMCARYEPRDYLDVMSLHEVLPRESIVRRAQEADAGFHAAYLADALRMLDRIPNSRFELPEVVISELRGFFEEWLADLEAQSD